VLCGWSQRAGVVVMRPNRRPKAQALGMAVCATALLGGRCSKSYDHLNREHVCAELVSRGSCVEGDTGCVLVNCGNGWDCNFGSPDEHDLPLVWVSTEALAEVGSWCQAEGGGWIENWCDDTRGETQYDVYVECYVQPNY